MSSLLTPISAACQRESALAGQPGTRQLFSRWRAEMPGRPRCGWMSAGTHRIRWRKRWRLSPITTPARRPHPGFS